MSEPVRDQVQAALGDSQIIERELQGDNWCVFVAGDAGAGRDLVVKVLPPEAAAGIDLARFRREISFAARLEDPTIVPILGWGDAGGLPYYTSPFAAGGSLRGVKLPVDDALPVLRDVARALAHAHGRGVLHRALDADKVFRSGDGAIVAGFGVRHALDVALDRPSDPTVDNRTDIHAFGLLARDLIEGQPRPALTALIGRCTSPNAADRPESASEIVAALDDMLSPSLGLLDQFWPTESATIDARREYYQRRLFITLGVLAAVVAIVAFIAVRSASRPSPAPPPGTVAAPIVTKVNTPAAPTRKRPPSRGDSLADVAATWLARSDSMLPPKDALPQARAAIARGLTLDPNNATLQLLEGVVAYLYDRDAAAALGYMRGAVAADPDVPGATRWYPQVLWANGLRDTATAYLRAAIARDSTSVEKLYDAWRYAHLSGDALRALQYCGALRQLRADALCEAMQKIDVGQPDLALALTDSSARAAGPRATSTLLDFVTVLAAARQLDSARRVVAAVDRQAAAAGSYMRPVDIALMHGRIGDVDGALQWLDRALTADAPGVGALYWRTIDNPVRSDPRTVAFAKRAGLRAPPPYWP